MIFESKKDEIEFKTRIREFVFGSQDGLISTLGLLAGVQTAFQNERTTAITGLAAMVTGGLSMATGSYLASKSQKEILDREVREQEDLIEREPYLAEEGVLESLTRSGLPRDSSFKVVALLRQERRLFLQTFNEKVLGLGTAELEKPFQAACVMFLSFVLGAVIPLFPYAFLPKSHPFALSVAASVSALFLIGFFKGHLAKKSRLLSGIEFLLVAFGSAGAGWLLGKVFERFFGVQAPV